MPAFREPSARLTGEARVASTARTCGDDDDDDFYLFLQKQKIDTVSARRPVLGGGGLRGQGDAPASTPSASLLPATQQKCASERPAFVTNVLLISERKCRKRSRHGPLMLSFDCSCRNKRYPYVIYPLGTLQTKTINVQGR